jgi:hypothetical protein
VSSPSPGYSCTLRIDAPADPKVTGSRRSDFVMSMVYVTSSVCQARRSAAVLAEVRWRLGRLWVPEGRSAYRWGANTPSRRLTCGILSQPTFSFRTRGTITQRLGTTEGAQEDCRAVHERSI